MEAAGVLGLTAGFKFTPDDDEIVALFLLPRLLGQRLPLDGIILEDDPLNAPPWTLLDKHKRKDDAFFFAAGQAINVKGSRQKRTCAGGGCWEGQKVCVDVEKLRVPDGGGLEIGWRKYALNFHAYGEKGSTGWVMHEYAVTAPAELASSSLRLYRIRFSGHGKKRKREAQDSCSDDGAARAAPRQVMQEPALLEEHPCVPYSVFPPMVVDPIDDDDGAATSSDQDPSGVTDDWPMLNFELLEDTNEVERSFEDFVVPDSWFLPSAELGEFNAGPPALPSDQGSQGVMAEFGGADAAAAAGTSSLDQGSSSAVMDDVFLNFDLLENIDVDSSFVLPDPCDLQAHLDDADGAGGSSFSATTAATDGQCSIGGMQTQSSRMQLMPNPYNPTWYAGAGPTAA